jgi:Anti-sigma-K factor rskA
MECPRCNTPLEESAVFCGHCGALLKPRLGPDVATINDVSDGTVPTVLTSLPPGTAYPQSPNQHDARSTIFDRDPFSGVPNVQREQRAQPNNIMSQPQQPYTPPAQAPMQPGGPTAQPRMQSGPRRRKLFIFLLLAVIIVGGAIASAILFVPRKPAPSVSVVASGQVKFFDSQASVAGNTDALSITASGLSNPPSGNQYDAWLIDTDSEQILSLGTLSKKGKSFTLAFNQPGRNLIGQGNEVEITQEQGQPSEPTAEPVLSATFPPRAFVHIRHLLTRFPTTPNHTGLLVGLLNQTQELNAQAAILQNSLGSDQGQVRQCLAQSMIDIIEGTNGADYSALSSWCVAQNITQTGDGFGLLDAGASAATHGYLTTAAQHAALAANQPDSTDLIRRQAKKVEISTDNIKALVESINADAMKLLSNPSDTSQVAEIVTRSDHAYHGFDQNGDGIIEPVLGEAGAITAYTQGQLMATLTLSASK